VMGTLEILALVALVVGAACVIGWFFLPGD
jgi:hypothetical protein